jgi:hypothetical protein
LPGGATKKGSGIGSRAADGALPTIEETDFYGSQLF